MRKLCTLVLCVFVLIVTTGAQCRQRTSTGTGDLRVLITDKPYPFEWIESAVVTITKVEIRRSGPTHCDDPCDDGLFCNGFENCVDGACHDATAPCADDEYCIEDDDACHLLCAEDADCDDASYCTGVETCDEGTGRCIAGAAPCPADPFCHEATQTCDDQCAADSECDDDAFCNGAETCNLVTGACLPGAAPACDEAEVCDEAANACVDEADDNGDDDDSGDDDDTDDDDDDDNPFIVIFQGERSFDLLDLQNGRTDLLADADDLPAGHYDQMRIFVTRGVVTLKDGAGEFVLTVPSGDASGIKLHFDFGIPQDGQATLLLDVDLSRAFRAIPSGHIEDPSTIEGFHFAPSLAMRLIDVLSAGRIAGTVTAQDASPIAHASVTAFDENDEEVTSTSTDPDGTYVLMGLESGTYAVEFSAAGFADAEVTGVVVEAGETTAGVDAVLTASP